MTQLFDENNMVVPVTVIDVSETLSPSSSLKTALIHNAVQLGIGERKSSQTNKVVQGHFAKAGTSVPTWTKNCDEADQAGNYNVGDTLQLDGTFAAGDKVDVTGTSKGRGFTGVKR